jgi:hypothetical protein
MRLNAIWLVLDARAGWVLENEDGIVAFDHDGERTVPVFSSLDGAELFAHQRDESAEVEPGENHDLAELIAFAGGARTEAPTGAFDNWILLDEIAWAAARAESLGSPHDLEPGLREGAPHELREAARAALAQTLDAARASTWFFE